MADCSQTELDLGGRIGRIVEARPTCNALTGHSRRAPCPWRTLGAGRRTSSAVVTGATRLAGSTYARIESPWRAQAARCAGTIIGRTNRTGCAVGGPRSPCNVARLAVLTSHCASDVGERASGARRAGHSFRARANRAALGVALAHSRRGCALLLLDVRDRCAVYAGVVPKAEAPDIILRL